MLITAKCVFWACFAWTKEEITRDQCIVDRRMSESERESEVLFLPQPQCVSLIQSGISFYNSGNDQE